MFSEVSSPFDASLIHDLCVALCFCCIKTLVEGYDGEETKHGYKVFGPLNIRRLMDEVPLRVRRQSVLNRQKRQTSMDSAFNTAPVSFNIDSVTAPLRFDGELLRAAVSFTVARLCIN